MPVPLHCISMNISVGDYLSLLGQVERFGHFIFLSGTITSAGERERGKRTAGKTTA